VCGCFSALSTVQLDNGSILAMKDLLIGDNALVGKDKFQPVYAFGKKAVSKPFAFIERIYTVASSNHSCASIRDQGG
jgi:hypothetical protein